MGDCPPPQPSGWHECVLTGLVCHKIEISVIRTIQELLGKMEFFKISNHPRVIGKKAGHVWHDMEGKPAATGCKEECLL